MTETKRNPKVDGFMRKAKAWKEEFEALREIALDCDLTEDMKWMHPCYMHEEKNVVLIHGFKEYCALLFHKGALLKDPTDSSSSKRRMFRPPASYGSRVCSRSTNCS